MIFRFSNSKLKTKNSKLGYYNIISENTEVYIYRVSSILGIIKKVSTTKGNGEANNIVNIELECLNLKIGR